MLPLSDVMAVQYVHSTDKSHCCPGLEVQNGSNIDDKPFGEHTSVTAPRHTSFILHYAAKGTKNTWRHDTVTLNHTDPRQVASWVKTIRNYLSGKLRHQQFQGCKTLGTLTKVKNFRVI